MNTEIDIKPNTIYYSKKFKVFVLTQDATIDSEAIFIISSVGRCRMGQGHSLESFKRHVRDGTMLPIDIDVFQILRSIIDEDY